MVPTFTWGFVRENFSLAMSLSRGAGGLCGGTGALAPLLDDLFLHRGGHRGVVRELHRVGRATLGPRAEVRRVPEHRGEGHLGLDDAGILPLAHVEDAA